MKIKNIINVWANVVKDKLDSLEPELKEMSEKRKGGFGENRGDTTVGFHLHPHNKDLIKGVDSRNWYMAQEVKYGGHNKIILDDIGNQNQTNLGLSIGPTAWKNANGTDFIAGANDIIEWTGTAWEIIFDASANATDNIVYTTNLNTGVQYKYVDAEWVLSFEGEYQNGSWRIVL